MSLLFSPGTIIGAKTGGNILLWMLYFEKYFLKRACSKNLLGDLYEDDIKIS